MVEIGIGGTSTSQFGRIDVRDTATLDGTLSLSLEEGFEPADGDSFRILTAGSRLGQFTTITGLALPNGLEFNPVYDDTGLTLAAGLPQAPGTAGVTIDTSDQLTALSLAPLAEGLAVSVAAAVQGDFTVQSSGAEFWLTFPTSLRSGGIQAELSLVVSGDSATSGTVEIPGLGFRKNFDVFPGRVTRVSLPLEADLGFTSDTVTDKGIRVTTSDPVSVYGASRAPESSDVFLGLPVELLGTEHLVLAYKNLDLNPNVDETFPGTEFAIVATQDRTSVTITPSVTSGAHAAGVPFAVNLNRGQTYLLQNSGFEPSDLTGTIVRSNNPVGVFSGHAAANVPAPAVGFADYLVEQVPPVSTWGTEFITAPLAGRQSGDTFRILAATDNTTVTLNGTAIATLNRGEFLEQVIDGAAHIRADQPVLVAQYANSSRFDGEVGDPFMMLVPATDQYLDRYTVTANIGGLPDQFINLIAPTTSVGSITLDGTAISVDRFTSAGSSGYSFAQLQAVNDDHVLAGPEPFAAWVYGFGQDEGFGYPAGMSVQVPDPTRVADLTLTPPAAVALTSTAHTVVANVVDTAGAPIAGAGVQFTVTGVHPVSGIAITGADGRAAFSYTGFEIGTDLIVAEVAGVSDTAEVNWTVGVPAISITSPGDGTAIDAGSAQLVSGRAAPGGPGVFIATVTVNGIPVDALHAGGEFFEQLIVAPGRNILEFEARDSLGQAATATLMLEGIQQDLDRLDLELFSTNVSASFEFLVYTGNHSVFDQNIQKRSHEPHQ